MKKILILAFLLLSLGTYAQREVPQSRMEQIYEEAKTPYKIWAGCSSCRQQA